MIRSSLFIPVAFVASLSVAQAGEVKELTELLKRADAAELQRRLAQDPVRVLAQLVDALPVALETASETRVVGCVTDAVVQAMTTARDPRVYVEACKGQTTPELVLAVVRGAFRLLERPPAGDQGVPDWPAFLSSMVAYEDSAAVREAACEALGKLPATKVTARALLRALSDEEAPVAAAARAVLERLSKATDRPAFERWAASLDGLAISPALLHGLAVGDVREALPWLRRRLLESPSESLFELAQALDELPAYLESSGAIGADDTADVDVAKLQLRVHDRVINLVAEAVRTIKGDDLRYFLDAAPDAQPPIAAGVARGIGRRAAPYVGRANPAEWRQRRTAAADAADVEQVEDERDAEVVEDERELPLAEELFGTLAVLAERTEPEVAREAFEAAASSVPHLDALWLELLTRPLERTEHGAVERAAWVALRTISGQDLPPSAPHWRRWWSGETPGNPDPASGN